MSLIGLIFFYAKHVASLDKDIQISSLEILIHKHSQKQ